MEGGHRRFKEGLPNQSSVLGEVFDVLVRGGRFLGSSPTVLDIERQKIAKQRLASPFAYLCEIVLKLRWITLLPRSTKIIA